MRALRRHLTFANVVSCLALFIALGGATAFAASELRKNSVGSRELKPKAVKTGNLAGNAVKTGKLAPEAAKAGKIAKNAIPTDRLRDGAVTGEKVRDGSLLAGDFAPGQLPAGPQGPQGPQGAQGPAGTAVAYATIDDEGVVIPGKSKDFTQANVDPDTQAGTICIKNLPFDLKNLQATAQGVFDGAQADVIATAYVSESVITVGDCEGQGLIRTYDVSSAELADRPVLIWLTD